MEDGARSESSPPSWIPPLEARSSCGPALSPARHWILSSADRFQSGHRRAFAHRECIRPTTRPRQECCCWRGRRSRREPRPKPNEVNASSSWRRERSQFLQESSGSKSPKISRRWRGCSTRYFARWTSGDSRSPLLKCRLAPDWVWRCTIDFPALPAGLGDFRLRGRSRRRRGPRRSGNSARGPTTAPRLQRL